MYNDIIKKNKLRIWLDLSTYCNAACPQCHRTNPDGLGKVDWLPLIQWDLKQFQKAFPKMDFIQEFEFCGSWGDPAMNKEIYEICEYIINNSEARIMIKTNGSMREGEFWWDLGVLCGNRLDVEFAVDGTTQEMHAKYRQKTVLAKVLEHLEIVAQTNARALVFTVLFKHNEDKIYDIAKMVYDLGAKKISLTPSNRFVLHHNTSLVETLQNFHYIKNNKNEKLKKSKLEWGWKSYHLTEKFIEKLKNEKISKRLV